MTSTDIRSLNQSFGTWSLVCLVISVLVISFLTGFNPQVFFADLPAVLRIGFVQTSLNIVETITVVFHSTSVLLVFALGSLVITSLMVKEATKPTFRTESLFSSGPHGIYLTILMEEFLFRQLSLGWLRPLFGGGLAITIVLFLLGNIIFAYIHIYNHSPETRNLWRVLPQLVLGGILAFLFLKYGFWVTLLIHLSYDFVLFAASKVQASIIEDIISGVYWLIVGLISWIVLINLGIGPEVISPWVSQTVLQPLALTTGELITVLVFISAVFGFVSNFFLLDEITDTSKFKEFSFGSFIVLFCISPIIYVSTVLFLNWILGFIIPDPFVRSLSIILISIFISSPKSGSGVANLWFFSSPFTFLYVFVVVTMSFWPAVLVIFSVSLVNFIPTVFNIFLGDLSK